MDIKGFNIRVYGLLFNEKEEVLLSDEFWFNTPMTKFPGGGLNPGEGLHDCLKREFREELDIKIEIVKHIYTTDFFQPTIFLPEVYQLISIYYQVRQVDDTVFKVSDKPFDFEEKEGAMSVRWKAISELRPDEMTLPIDRRLVGMLHQTKEGRVMVD